MSGDLLQIGNVIFSERNPNQRFIIEKKLLDPSDYRKLLTQLRLLCEICRRKFPNSKCPTECAVKEAIAKAESLSDTKS